MTSYWISEPVSSHDETQGRERHVTTEVEVGVTECTGSPQSLEAGRDTVSKAQPVPLSMWGTVGKGETGQEPQQHLGRDLGLGESSQAARSVI